MPRLPFPVLPRRLRWAAVAIAAAAIFYQSLVTVPPQTVPRPEFAPLDRWLHVVAYAGLGATVAYALVDSSYDRSGRALRLVLAVGLYGVLVEVLQAPLPERYFALGDLVANTVGSALALTWYGLEPYADPIPIVDLLNHRR